MSHGFCAAKFACVGCAGKVPDPAKRPQLERHRAWAQTQVALATDDGLYPEAERMKQLVRDCETELEEWIRSTPIGGTKPMPPTSTSRPEHGAPSWLQEKVYTPRRQRTLALVRHTVDALVTRQLGVSLASIATTSKTIDPTGRGVSPSAILGNAEARAY